MKKLKAVKVQVYLANGQKEAREFIVTKHNFAKVKNDKSD